MIFICFPKIGVNLQLFGKQIEIKLLHPASTLKSRIQVKTKTAILQPESVTP
ncbi:MAG: hypothetical protein P8X79_00885 [Reinekea sp.]